MSEIKVKILLEVSSNLSNAQVKDLTKVSSNMSEIHVKSLNLDGNPGRDLAENLEGNPAGILMKILKGINSGAAPNRWRWMIILKPRSTYA